MGVCNRLENYSFFEIKKTINEIFKLQVELKKCFIQKTMGDLCKPIDHHQNKRVCECGFIPYESNHDLRRHHNIKPRPDHFIRSFYMNKKGQCECGYTPSHKKANKSKKYNKLTTTPCPVKSALGNHIPGHKEHPSQPHY